jgi:hypothetical protein
MSPQHHRLLEYLQQQNQHQVQNTETHASLSKSVGSTSVLAQLQLVRSIQYIIKRFMLSFLDAAACQALYEPIQLLHFQQERFMTLTSCQDSYKGTCPQLSQPRSRQGHDKRLSCAATGHTCAAVS